MAWEGQFISLTLVLKQQGPKVTGRIGTGTGIFAAVEGNVEGDVFRFAQTFGQVRSEATVDGDEMTGEVTGGYFGARSRLFLRRGESPVPESQEEPPSTLR